MIPSKRTMLPVAGVVASAVALCAPLSSQAGVYSLSDAFTDDASTGISTANTYTHAISGNEAVTVNGVDFVRLSNSITPANFAWDSDGAKAVVANANNSWQPATGGVTGAGIIDLLSSFTYSNGMSGGFAQTFTLSGLTPGETYDARLYIRTWDTGGNGRPIDISVDDGTSAVAYAGNPLQEDRPNLVGYSSVHSAYYLNYRYTATDGDIDIIATNAAGSGASFHMYALTNQVVPEPGSLALLALGGMLVARRRRG